MRQALTFTEEQKNAIINYYTNGDSSTTIINKLKEQDSSFKCSKQTMNKFIDSLNIKRNPKRKSVTISDESKEIKKKQKENIISQGLIYHKTVKQIRKMYKVSSDTVTKILNDAEKRITPHNMVLLKWKTLWKECPQQFNMVRTNDEYLNSLYNKLQNKIKEEGRDIYIEKNATFNYEDKSLTFDLYCPAANVYITYAGGRHLKNEDLFEENDDTLYYYGCINYINLNEGGHNLSDCLDYMTRVENGSEKDVIIKYDEYTETSIDEAVDSIYNFLVEKILMQ